jgi:hypothetical protein
LEHRPHDFRSRYTNTKSRIYRIPETTISTGGAMLKRKLLSLVEKTTSRELDLIAFAKEYGKFTYKDLELIKEDKDYEVLRDLKSHAGFFNRKWGNGDDSSNKCTASCCQTEDESRADFYEVIVKTHKIISS